MTVGHVIDWDDIEVCGICGTQTDISQGEIENALGGEFVCMDCIEVGRVQETLDNTEHK